MGKVENSIEKKVRKWSARFPSLERLAVYFDKKKAINVDYLSQIYPNDAEIKRLQVSAQTAYQALLHDIHESDDYAIPKTIWIYWDKGLDAAPDLVQEAYDSWKVMNPEYEVRFLDEKNVQDYFDFNALFHKSSIDIGIAHKSDFIRVYLLSRFGGVWVDSTTWCWKSLDEWLPQETEQCGFFVFKQPSSRVDRQIKNWFIASSKGNPITLGLLKEMTEFNFKLRRHTLRVMKTKEYRHITGLSQEGTGFEVLKLIEQIGGYPYFYFHYLFNEVVKQGKPQRLWAIAKQTINAHTNTGSEINDALVSKQNYKAKYRASLEYQQRLTLMNQLKEKKQSIVNK